MVGESLRTGMLSGVNRQVARLEARLAEITETRNVVAMGDCTSALILTVKALGWKSIAMPSFTFSATALAAWWNQARIVFIDCDRSTLNVSPKDLAKKLQAEHIDGVIATHVFGNPCAMDEIREATAPTNTPVIYDAAHALGSRHAGEPIGRRETSIFSFSPTKVVTSGEGGAVATRTDWLANSLRELRNYGNKPDYQCEQPGLNARMSEIHAAIGLAQLDNLDRYVANRNLYAARYRQVLEDRCGLKTQAIRRGDRTTYKDFAVLCRGPRQRQAISRTLTGRRIGHRFYFDPPLHRLVAFSPAEPVHLPATGWASSRVICLPVHNVMERRTVDAVAAAVLAGARE